MQFARKVWHLLVAIKDGLVLLLLLGFFVLVHAVLTARGGPPALDNGALLLNLDGRVVEEPSEASPLRLGVLTGTSRSHEYRARDLVRAIRAAAGDDHIKAVAIDLSRFVGGGQVHIEEIGAALDGVRAAKKPVLVYGTEMSDSGMLLAAHASEVWIDPLGGIVVTGPGGYHMYYGKLLEKLKIDAHVFRVGTYKDYVEPYIRNDQSEPAKAARTALYAALWGDWKANVAKARPKAQIDRVTSDPVGWIKAAGGDGAQAALAAGLADKIGSRADFGARVAKIAGQDDDDKTYGAFASNTPASLLAAHKESTSGKAIAVVTIAGDIEDGKAGPGTAGSDRIAGLIDAAGKKDVAGLVIRVDSPGGSVTGSELIRQAILRQKAKGIPVAVSMANLAASGGYWVSTPGARLFAEPATVTGSIGIFGVIPSFERALASWGVNGDGVRTTPLSGQPDPLTGLTPEVEAMLQSYIERGYQRFVGLVAASRHKTGAQVDAIAQGRVWDGGTALKLGLVDQVGGIDDALAWTASQAKLSSGDWHPVWLGKDTGLVARLRDALGDDQSEDDSGATVPRDAFGMVALRQREVVARALTDAARMLGGQGAQAYCLDCPTDAMAPSAAPTGAAALTNWSWLARIGGWLGLG